MRYLIFSFWFMIFHTIAYMLAGAISLKTSKDIYRGRERIMDYLRDMSSEQESSHVQRWVLPSQLLRGLLMSIVLYPVLGPIGELSFALRLLFMVGLLFIYTHLSSAAPCIDNIEGFIYMKEQYIKKRAFLNFQREMIIYSLVLGILFSWLLF